MWSMAGAVTLAPCPVMCMVWYCLIRIFAVVFAAALVLHEIGRTEHVRARGHDVMFRRGSLLRVQHARV